MLSLRPSLLPFPAPIQPDSAISVDCGFHSGSPGARTGHASTTFTFQVWKLSDEECDEFLICPWLVMLYLCDNTFPVLWAFHQSPKAETWC
jgi:hypothetical protein